MPSKDRAVGTALLLVPSSVFRVLHRGGRTPARAALLAVTVVLRTALEKTVTSQPGLREINCLISSRFQTLPKIDTKMDRRPTSTSLPSYQERWRQSSITFRSDHSLTRTSPLTLSKRWCSRSKRLLFLTPPNLGPLSPSRIPRTSTPQRSSPANRALCVRHLCSESSLPVSAA